jgi:mRNA interferase HicA
MILAATQSGMQVPFSRALLEPMPVEIQGVSAKRIDLVRYFKASGYSLLREGANHSIYSNGAKIIPVKRHRTIDRITANGLIPKF